MRPLRWGWLLAALVVAGLTTRLGFWQLDRAAQKLALQAAITDRGNLPSLPQQELANEATLAAHQWHRPATVQGQWWSDATVLLDNRQMNGRPGFFVLTPMRLADGSALLVQRGWIARDANDRLRADVPRLPAGEQTIEGRLAPPPSRLLDFGDPGRGAIRQNLDLDAYGRELGVRLRPLLLLQTAPGTAPDGLLRNWPRPAADTAKHHGYAFQWFALSALAIALYAGFQFRRPH